MVNGVQSCELDLTVPKSSLLQKILNIAALIPKKQIRLTRSQGDRFNTMRHLMI